MLSPAQADTLVAAAVDRALARCAPNDPPALVAVRVGWAVRAAMAGAGLTRPRIADPTAIPTAIRSEPDG